MPEQHGFQPGGLSGFARQAAERRAGNEGRRVVVDRGTAARPREGDALSADSGSDRQRGANSPASTELLHRNQPAQRG